MHLGIKIFTKSMKQSIDKSIVQSSAYSIVDLIQDNTNSVMKIIVLIIVNPFLPHLCLKVKSV